MQKHKWDTFGLYELNTPKKCTCEGCSAGIPKNTLALYHFEKTRDLGVRVIWYCSKCYKVIGEEQDEVEEVKVFEYPTEI